MQPISEIERDYEKEDPWGYQANDQDMFRKQRVLSTLDRFLPSYLGIKDAYTAFEKALDIGAGEGWITQDLPARVKHGFEVSNNAAERFPKSVERVTAPGDKYDLVTATGIMYPHYNWPLFLALIERCSKPGTILLTCNIKNWEIPHLQDPSEKYAGSSFLKGKQIYQEEFDYREYVQKLRVFRI